MGLAPRGEIYASNYGLCGEGLWESVWGPFGRPCFHGGGHWGCDWAGELRTMNNPETPRGCRAVVNTASSTTCNSIRGERGEVFGLAYGGSSRWGSW